MTALRIAAPLARLLLAVGESGREVDLVFMQCEREVRLSVARGRVLGIEGVEVASLGDTLLSLGALDVRAAFLPNASVPNGSAKVGARLVAAGATTSQEVVRALERQLESGLAVTLRAPLRQLRLTAPSRPRSVASLDLTSAVWRVLEELARTSPQHAPAGTLSLTTVGRRRTSRFPADVTTRALSSPSTLREVMFALGFAVPTHEPDDAYALLLRKSRELARKESAAVLLELQGSSAPEHTRRALRRLVKRLHPDRFDASDDRLRALSTRVLGALNEAEHMLRTRQSA